MGITLNTDMYMLCSLFDVSAQKIYSQYSGMSVEEIMKVEAESGNSKAANFDSEVLSNPAKLVELFQLNNVGNKYQLLSNMNEHDLQQLLPLLDQSDLIAGLQFFDKEKLLSLTESLPKDQLLKYTQDMFSQQQLMQYMPESQLDKMLSSTDIDKHSEMSALSSLNPAVLSQMYEAATGQSMQIQENSTNMDGSTNAAAINPNILGQLQGLPDDKFQEAILNMPPASKKNFSLIMAQSNPNLLESIDSSAYSNIIGQKKDKQDMLRSANTIEPEQLVKMLEKLPKDLTAVVLTQIDPMKLAKVLQSSFKQILSQVVAG